MPFMASGTTLSPQDGQTDDAVIRAQALRAEVLDGRGFVLLCGVPVENRPIAESAAAYWGIGSYFGSARSQNAKGHLLGHIYDLGGSSATNPNIRSYATRNARTSISIAVTSWHC